ncbi:class I SAM-dependent methyltransferase [Gracilibacillus caseinilyticus]|uniref:Class I SAM-dependent methyltransferase n=1 Tax=Gracilibacillus caseinilyticus TaxID=2932256 RepID=A0ABY4EZF2_9BACI|nr:class I SAM-dependent methyltransferase [Gracilibacillus caseinilyticus]UOQ49019.1 class I SAM-dependent methyltransferase [Gracilibacillus caseinilyticus]
MGINFHNQGNRTTYTTRTADHSWLELIKKIVPFENVSQALEIGCGGGIYSKALADLGAQSVTALDFSRTMLEGARENCKYYHNISFKYGSAYETGLESNSFELLLERALIHHIKDLDVCFHEAFRLLQDNSLFIVQDRTLEGCLLKGDNSHIRGYFFECFPRLIETEVSRRHKSHVVLDTLKEAGFKNIEVMKLWETRKVYQHKKQLLRDISERTGRSILHELDDEELQLLVSHIDNALPGSSNTSFVEKDRWTIWVAEK